MASNIRNTTSILALTAAAAFGQYKLEPGGAPPAELAAPIAADLQPAGHKVIGKDGKVLCEIWIRKAAQTGAPTTETDVTFKTLTFGSVVGAISFPGKGEDRRGQPLKAGVYTLRFALQPVNGDHQGVAPQRDFLALAPAAADTDSKPVTNVDALMNLSRKASGNPHPAVLSMWKVEDADFKPGFSQMGEHDWVLQVAVGDAKVAIVLVGKAEG